MKTGRLAGIPAVILLAATVFAPVRTTAQVLKGQILGTITDTSGAVSPGVKITVTETRTNFRRTADSNDSGNFFL